MQLPRSLLNLFNTVSAKPFLGGLEISDSTLRFIFPQGNAFHYAGVRIEPGVLENGKILNRTRFIEALRFIKIQALGKGFERKRISVVASVGSSAVYSQIFNLPNIVGDNLEKAIHLNMQMLSPIDIAQSYPSWQIVGQDEHAGKIEILAAFIDRKIADELRSAFYEAGYTLVVLESRALAFARLFRERALGVDLNRSYVLVCLDDAGIDFIILRHGQAYFEYFNPWKGIVNDKGEVSAELFRAAITRGLYQILNFYSQHWPEPLSEVVVSAPALLSDLATTIQENFPLTPRNLELRGSEDIGIEWFPSFGSALRGLRPRRTDTEISLLETGAVEEFEEERLIGLLSFWRLLFPIMGSVFAGLFLLADLFLGHTITTMPSPSSGSPSQDANAIATEAQQFNQNVSFIHTIEAAAFPKSNLSNAINTILSAGTITAIRIAVDNPTDPLLITGIAPSEDAFSTMKGALENSPFFTNVNVPLSGITTDANGQVHFSITVSVRSAPKVQ